MFLKILNGICGILWEMRTAYALEGVAFILLIVMAETFAARSIHPSFSWSNNAIISTNTIPMTTATLTLTSPAFVEGTSIPSAYTCDGQDVHPELQITGVPGDAKSLVLIMDDPDSPTGTWDHWVVFNIPATTLIIEAGKEPDGVQGKNTWQKAGYGGPCPGQGEHHYRFKLYALDTLLELSEGATKQEIEQAMQGHILAQTILTGLYQRNK